MLGFLLLCAGFVSQMHGAEGFLPNLGGGSLLHRAVPPASRAFTQTFSRYEGGSAWSPHKGLALEMALFQGQDSNRHCSQGQMKRVEGKRKFKQFAAALILAAASIFGTPRMAVRTPTQPGSEE